MEKVLWYLKGFPVLSRNRQDVPLSDNGENSPFTPESWGLAYMNCENGYCDERKAKQQNQNDLRSHGRA
ncbi:hypothetical protein D3C86_948170 [compost metagenome]